MTNLKNQPSVFSGRVSLSDSDFDFDSEDFDSDAFDSEDFDSLFLDSRSSDLRLDEEEDRSLLLDFDDFSVFDFSSVSSS